MKKILNILLLCSLFAVMSCGNDEVSSVSSSDESSKTQYESSVESEDSSLNSSTISDVSSDQNTTSSNEVTSNTIESSSITGDEYPSFDSIDDSGYTSWY